MSDSLLHDLENPDDDIAHVLAALDPQQRLAVTNPARTVRILAGPGSGKTRVLTSRIQRRIIDGSADPRHVLALTFTRRAASEIRSRLRGAGIRDLSHIGTFHAMALQQLRQHRADNGKLGPEVIANRPAVLRSLAPRARELGAAVAEIERSAASGIAPGSNRRRTDGVASLVAELQASYASYKRRKGLLDFDDILVECTRLLDEDHRFAAAQRWRFRHLFVDEFQDVNRTQFELLRGWLGDGDDLCIVGDPDQAIYGWNGADARYLTGFTRWYPGAVTVTLSTNHRSSGRVVEAAHAVLGDREVEVRKPTGTHPTSSSHETAEAEAEEVAARIRWVNSSANRWSAHAVLARTNAQLDVMAESLDRAQIPYRIRGRGGLSRRPAARAVIDSLNASGDRFSTVLADTDLDVEAGTDTDAVIELAHEYASTSAVPTGSGFSQWMRTVRAGDIGSDVEAVDLVTFHAAKGLEWRHVTIIGFEEGLVPMNNSDEEQRLAYVAMTRAEATLHLSWCRSRPVRGLLESRSPSRWMAPIAAQAADPVPAAPDQIESHMERARDVTGSAPDESRVNRLIVWRNDAARARNVDVEAVLRTDLLHAIADGAPKNVADLTSLTGLSALRLRRDGTSILAALNVDLSARRR